MKKRASGAEMSAKKEKLYAEYKKIKAEMNELSAAKSNVDKLFQVVPHHETKTKENQQR